MSEGIFFNAKNHSKFNANIIGLDILGEYYIFVYISMPLLCPIVEIGNNLFHLTNALDVKCNKLKCHHSLYL